MVGFQSFSLRCLWVIVAVELGGMPPAARAQEEVESPEVPVPEGPQPAMTREQFQQWIDQVAFGSQDALPAAHAELETILSLKIEHLERTCEITDTQKRKLELAGRGDIKRFFDRLADHRRKYDRVKDSQQELGRLQTEVQELANRRGKPMFEQGSIFGKTLARILTAEQTARFDTAARQSRCFRHRAKVDLVVQNLDIVAGLSDQQRERLTQLLLHATKPARNSFVDFDVEIVIAQAGALPESQIRPIFDQDQWRSIAPILQKLKQNYQETLHDVELAVEESPGSHPSGPAATPPASAEPEKSRAK